jgi:hypothetical protein
MDYIPIFIVLNLYFTNYTHSIILAHKVKANISYRWQQTLRNVIQNRCCQNFKAKDDLRDRRVDERIISKRIWNKCYSGLRKRFVLFGTEVSGKHGRQWLDVLDMNSTIIWVSVLCSSEQVHLLPEHIALHPRESLSSWCWMFTFHKRRGIYGLEERLLASQAGPYSMELTTL